MNCRQHSRRSDGIGPRLTGSPEIGSGKDRWCVFAGECRDRANFAQWIALLKDLGVTTPTMRNTGGTDRLSFDALGNPGFQFIQDLLD